MTWMIFYFSNWVYFRGVHLHFEETFFMLPKFKFWSINKTFRTFSYQKDRSFKMGNNKWP